MIKVYQYVPGWTVACISPYVSKLANYMRMAAIPFELTAADLSRLKTDTPRGKLPVLVDDDGTEVCDSTEIIHYLKGKYGDPLDGDASDAEKAQMVAWNRMIDEHTYWAGVIEPRWRMDDGWETYVPIICGGATEIPAEVRQALDAFREHIQNEHVMQGTGLKPNDVVKAAFAEDIDAISAQLADNPYFMGNKPRSIDAAVFSILTHTIESPFPWDGFEHARSKSNFPGYLARMREKYDLNFS